MRRSAERLTAIVIAIAASVGLPAAPAAAAHPVKARPVIRGLDTPTAFTFGSGNVIWYIEKANGQIHTYDLDSGRDVTFATIPGVNAEGASAGCSASRSILGTPRSRSSTSTRRAA